MSTFVSDCPIGQAAALPRGPRPPASAPSAQVESGFVIVCPAGERGAVMRVVLGTMTFGRRMDLATAGRALEAFSDWGGGGGELDTAFMYGGGETERILGEILAQRGWEGITLATKAHPGAADGTPSLRPEEVERQLTGSLQRLQCDAVDLFYLHSPDNATPLERTLEACARLHAAGKFRRLGLSNYAAWQVADAYHLCNRHGWPLPEVYQGMYNAVTRDVEPELLPCLRHLGMSFYAYNPLAGGLLTGQLSRRHGGAVASGRFQRAGKLRAALLAALLPDQPWR